MHPQEGPPWDALHPQEGPNPWFPCTRRPPAARSGTRRGTRGQNRQEGQERAGTPKVTGLTGKGSAWEGSEDREAESFRWNSRIDIQTSPNLLPLRQRRIADNPNPVTQPSLLECRVRKPNGSIGGIDFDNDEISGQSVFTSGHTATPFLHGSFPFRTAKSSFSIVVNDWKLVFEEVGNSPVEMLLHLLLSGPKAFHRCRDLTGFDRIEEANG